MADYLKIPELARRLDVSEKTARRYIKAGALPSTFIGGAYRVTEEDLEAYLHGAEVKPEGTSPKAPGRSSLELSLFNGLEDQRHAASVLSEALITTAGRLATTARPETLADVERHFGILDVLFGIAKPITALTDNSATWEHRFSVEEREALESVTSQLVIAGSKLLDQADEYLKRASEEIDDHQVRRDAEQLREQVREWTRRIA